MQGVRLKTYMETGRVVFLAPRVIRPNPAQPRKSFDGTALGELADSIRTNGLLQPLTVRRSPEGYELICGERRLRAAVLAGLNEVPCIVMTMDEKASGAAALVENLQREGLDFAEQARAIRKLMELCSLSQEQVARWLGISQSAVANKLRLLRHEPEVLEAMTAAKLTERHARALLRLEGVEQKLAAVRFAAAEQLSVAATEKYIESILAEKPAGKTPGKGVESLLSGLNRKLAKIQSLCAGAVSQRTETEKEIVYTITIPK